MNTFLEILPFYYFVAFIIGIVAGLMISVDNSVFEMEYVTSNKQEFLRCVFMYQVGIWNLLSDEINFVGMMILEILITFSVWFLNIIIFFILIASMILKLICYLFWFVFRKRNTDMEESEE